MSTPVPVNRPESKALDLVDPFRSERLIYRGIEDTDADKKFYDKIQKDPISHAYCGGLIQRPQNRRDSDKILSSIRESTLAAYICLAGHTNSTTSASQGGEHGDGENKDNVDGGPTVIGMITLDDGKCDEFRYLHQHRHMDLEIFIAPEYQNKGYGTEAVNWGLDWAFRFAGAHRVYLCTVSFNERASRVYEKIGFKLEGRFREQVWYDRKWWDLLWYSLLEHEWEQLRGS